MVTLSNTVRSLSAGAALLALLVSASLPVLAADAETDTKNKVVSLHGLDLASAADQEVLRHRLYAAAGRVCTRDGDGLQDGDFNTCRKAAFDHAWTQAQPMISAARSRSLFAASAGFPQWSQPKTVVAAAAR